MLRIVVLTIGLLASISVYANFEIEQATINKMVINRQYASAGLYINNRADLLKEPRFLRQLSHILVTDYTMAISFELFALKDIHDGERLEELRGAPGTYQLVGGEWEKVLYEAFQKYPESPDINFAVGEYLSRKEVCSCGNAEYFVGEQARDYRYFDLAYKAGIVDYWSLFRIGNHYFRNPGGARQAVFFFLKSLALNPENIDANYNIASAYYQIKDYPAAKVYAEKTLGQYHDASFNADTYVTYARIEAALGNHSAAERAYQKAIALKDWDERAFTGLLDIYRTTKRFGEYKQRVAEYIALDYSNTYTFNVYVDYLSQAGMVSADREIMREFALKTFTRPEERGAVFFNLGRIAEIEKNDRVALVYYDKSLAALKELKLPPQGSMEALTQAISNLEQGGLKK